MLYTGDEGLEVVGESHYQDALWRIVGGRRLEPVRHPIEAVLELEPHNVYDGNAICVRIEGEVVGYLSRDDAAAYREGLVRLIEASSSRLVALEGQIVGGGPRGNGIGFLGVFLDHSPADFGVRTQPPASTRSLRTGLSEAMATDLADDSYDLSWYETLSEDDATAIAQLRRLLESERDPIDRHYMFCELAKLLYKRRGVAASALEEFDEVCLQHNAEMSSIRPALVEKFGVVPVIDMYRQAAVRWQKAKDWETARDWASRGLAVYGEDAAKAEPVDDLQKRYAYATAKLDAASAPIRPRKPRGTAVLVASSTAITVEALVCSECGASFERVRTRGRKPKACPACRGFASSPAPS